MKKSIKMFSLFMSTLGLFSLASCGSSAIKNGTELTSNISFDELKDMSSEIDYSESINYSNITGSQFTFDSSITNISRIDCLGSSLIINDAKILNPLKSTTISGVNTTNMIQNNISFSCTKTSTYYTTLGYVYYSSSYPIAIYTTSSSFIIIDCYGNTLDSYSFTNNVSLNSISKKTVNKVTYFSLETSEKTSYFKYEYKDGSYTVKSITKDDYNSALKIKGENEYDDGLIPRYNSKGELICYLFYGNNGYHLYNKDKEYVNTFYPNAQMTGFSTNNSFDLENSIIFYKNEEYYPNENEKSSKTTYKCTCAEFNLKNGKVTYTDDFKYYITDHQEKYDKNDIFKGTYVIYYELNDKGERKDILKASVMKDELSFKSSALYENIRDNYKINENKLLVRADSNYFIVTKDNRVLLNGISSIKFVDNDQVKYKNQDGLYYICKVDDLEGNVKTVNKGYGYITDNKIDGKTTNCEYNSKTNIYKVGSYTLDKNYLNLLENNIYVTSTSISVGSTSIFTLTNTKKVSSISEFLSYTDSKLYRIDFTDGTTKYMKVKFAFAK